MKFGRDLEDRGELKRAILCYDKAIVSKFTRNQKNLDSLIICIEKNIER